MFKPSSREIPIEKQAATLLFIDVQNYNARRDGGICWDVDNRAE